jgi:hypothetical protein
LLFSVYKNFFFKYCSINLIDKLNLKLIITILSLKIEKFEKRLMIACSFGAGEGN